LVAAEGAIRWLPRTTRMRHEATVADRSERSASSKIRPYVGHGSAPAIMLRSRAVMFPCFVSVSILVKSDWHFDKIDAYRRVDRDVDH
jgi:hypothetical protein